MEITSAKGLANTAGIWTGTANWPDDAELKGVLVTLKVARRCHALPALYKKFRDKENGCSKVVMKP